MAELLEFVLKPTSEQILSLPKIGSGFNPVTFIKGSRRIFMGRTEFNKWIVKRLLTGCHVEQLYTDRQIPAKASSANSSKGNSQKHLLIEKSKMDMKMGSTVDIYFQAGVCFIWCSTADAT